MPVIWLWIAGCVEYKPGAVDREPATDSGPQCTECPAPSEHSALVSQPCGPPAVSIEAPFELVAQTSFAGGDDWQLAGPILISGPESRIGVQHEDEPLYTHNSMSFGSDGHLRWEVASLGWGSPYAAAFVSASPDEGPLLVAPYTEGTYPWGLGAYDEWGNVRWTWGTDYSSEAESLSGWSMYDLTVADLEGDGRAEILTMGSILSLETGLRIGRYDFDFTYSKIAVADVDLDGDLEWMQAGVLYNTEGERIYAIDTGWVNMTSIALQADDDPYPEFLIVDDGFILADTDGTVLARVDRQLYNRSIVLAQLDGEGLPELVVSDAGSLYAYFLDGTLYWQRDEYLVGEDLFGWDMDADGRSELLFFHGSESGIGYPTITDSEGNLLWQEPRTVQASGLTVADITQDGHAEILFGGGITVDGVTPLFTAYEHVHNQWPGAGATWPLWDFYLNSINPDGTVPRGSPDPPSFNFNVHHARPAWDTQGANLSPVWLATCSDTCADLTRVEAAVANTGERPAFDVTLSLMRGEVRLAQAVIPRIGEGEQSAGVVLDLPGEAYDLSGVELVVDIEDAWPECVETDNRVTPTEP